MKTVGTTSHKLECLELELQIITGADEDVGKTRPSRTAGGETEVEDSLGVLRQLLTELPGDPAGPLPGVDPGQERAPTSAAVLFAAADEVDGTQCSSAKGQMNECAESEPHGTVSDLKKEQNANA